MEGLEKPIDIRCLAGQRGKYHQLIRHPSCGCPHILGNENIGNPFEHGSATEAIALPTLTISTAAFIDSESSDLISSSRRSMVRHGRRHSYRMIWIAFPLSPLLSSIQPSIAVASSSVYCRRMSCCTSSGMRIRGSCELDLARDINFH